ncbi:acyl-CoA dehydrogenase family protein [Nocardia sp. CA-129566]|uniref:acyl-CoA dehydrogenase family protein n=1 Tax=Nocardia sp. CA-129566 TaxID=3239976 RepID=UPI003D952922
MSESLGPLAEHRAKLGTLVGDNAERWDLTGELPIELLRTLGSAGVLCAQVPADHGGLGASSSQNGEFTAYAGSLCSSLRSIMTSQGMATWTVQRLGDRDQRRAYLEALTTGQLAAVGFSEPEAGSDLSAIGTEIRPDGDSVVLEGQKKWVTGARYADLLVIFGRHREEAAAVVVPADTPGVLIQPVEAPLGCRAAGHANIHLDAVRLPATAVLGGGGQSLSLLFTTALTYGRMSVAWGCVGILRACLAAATDHARGREQSGKPLAQHQLIARHLADLFAAEQTSTRICEHGSRCWDDGSPDLFAAAVLAKHVSAGNAARAATSAVQVLASAGAVDGHVVARAYRDAKLMEIIEGSNEICQLILAQQALAVSHGGA